MSYRTPFVTSYIYPPDRAAISHIVDVLQRWAIDVRVIDIPPTGSYAISGLVTATWPGAIPADNINELDDMLRAGGVAVRLAFAFAGESAEDQFVYVYEANEQATITRRPS